MASTIDLLNELLALHCYSLPRYLVNARPWVSRSDSSAVEALALVAADHQRMTDLIGSLILDLGGAIQPGEFPMMYTDMHDLSSEYIVNETLRFQRLEIARIEEIASKLSDQPKPHAIAKEALGAAKGHVQNLSELLSKSTA